LPRIIGESMKYKKKDKVKLSRGVGENYLEETVQRVLLFATNTFEREGFDTQTAFLEASKIIFAFPNDYLNGYTVAQWMGTGGSEKRAYEAIIDYVAEAKKAETPKKEEKVITAKVFSSG